MGYIKFMQSFDKRTMREVERQAKRRGISKQEMIRAIMVPDWLEHYRQEKKLMKEIRATKID